MRQRPATTSQFRTSYDFLNPENRRNLHLKDRQWVDKSEVEYPRENKQIVRIMEQDIQQVKDAINQRAV